MSLRHLRFLYILALLPAHVVAACPSSADLDQAHCPSSTNIYDCLDKIQAAALARWPTRVALESSAAIIETDQGRKTFKTGTPIFFEQIYFLHYYAKPRLYLMYSPWIHDGAYVLIHEHSGQTTALQGAVDFSPDCERIVGNDLDNIINEPSLTVVQRTRHGFKTLYSADSMAFELVVNTRWVSNNEIQFETKDENDKSVRVVLRKTGRNWMLLPKSVLAEGIRRRNATR